MEAIGVALAQTMLSTVSSAQTVKALINAVISSAKKQKVVIELIPAEIKPPVIKSETNLAAYKEQWASEFDKSLHKADEKIPDNRTEDFLVNWIEDTRKELRRQREERRRQASITFITALTSLITGIVLLFIGIIIFIIMNLPFGIITAASGIICDAISGLAFAFNRDANNKLHGITSDMNRIDQTHTAMQYIMSIEEKTVRDQAILSLIQNMSNKND